MKQSQCPLYAVAMMKSMFLVLCALVGFSAASQCRHPPAAEGYTNEKYSGIWYEIGRIQTAGGAIFQTGAECTSAEFTPNDGSEAFGDGNIHYSAREFGPHGPFNNVSGTLKALDKSQNGHFEQTLVILGIKTPAVDYNVVYLDDDAAIEYDCSPGAISLLTNYCIHVMSRTPTMKQEKLDQLLAFADKLDLNANKIEFNPTKQEECWSN